MFGTFAIANGILFHPTIRGVVYARDAASGQELWRADTGAPIGSGIDVSDEGVYVSAGFSLGSGSSGGQIVAYGLAPAGSTMVELRADTFKELTPEQCQAALASLRPEQACRDCLCNCDPSTTGACHGACWEQVPCLLSNCADVDFTKADGAACYADHCTSKLLPPNVYQESIRSAKCALSCVASCTY